MSKITLIGRLGQDAKIKELEDNRFVINFSVAENIKTQRNEPTDNQITFWYSCSYFTRSNRIIEYLPEELPY